MAVRDFRKLTYKGQDFSKLTYEELVNAWLQVKLKELLALCDAKQEEIAPTVLHHWQPAGVPKFYKSVRRVDLPGGPSQKVVDAVRNYDVKKNHIRQCTECGGNDKEGHGIGCSMTPC